MPISEYLENDKKYLAHKNGKTKDGVSKNPETIEEHSSLVLDYAKRIIKVKNLQPILEKIGKRFFERNSENYKLWETMFFDTIYLHDLGKANTDFQSLKMKNSSFSQCSQNRNSEHSPCSASLYFSKYFEQINELSDKKIFFLFLLLNCYVISKHHGYLKSFSSFLDDFENVDKFFYVYKKLLPDISFDFSIMGDEKKLSKRKRFAKSTLDTFEDSECYKTIDLYIYTKLLYSLLVSADFYATSDYMNNNKSETPEDFGVITDVNKFFKPFSETDVYNNIQKYSKNRKQKDFADINEARSEMFLESEENLLNHLDKNLFYLEAPTGSGKTNTAINLSLQIVKNRPNINKIFYVFPFNTLVEQTKNTLLKSFNASVGDEIGVINSITPIYEEDERTNKAIIKDADGKNLHFKPVDYNKILFGRQFLHYPIVVTTHVKMFDWLFGLGREAHFPLCQIANSVIILDEIQSYKNSIWKEIAIFLNRYAELLNIKIIIMSATLPKIDKLIPDRKDTVENIFQDLISDRKKYFECKWFKDRVTPNFDLINSLENTDEYLKIQTLQEKIFEEYKNGKDVLVEFITKKRSLDFFKNFKEKYENQIPEKSVLLMNGDDNLYTRNKIISEIKNNNRDYKIILFSTQVIEAGVDIDLDVGFKDISILDAEEQFMGRINRSCKKSDCRVYFFNLDDKRIYKEDRRIDVKLTLQSEEIQDILKNKDFGKYYEKVLEKLDDISLKNTSENLDDFRKNVLQNLDFQGIQRRLKLLKDENTYTVFLNRTIEIEDGNILKGCEVWQQYKDLLENYEMGYAEKQIELSKINKDLSYFTYSVRKITQDYSDVIGDIYYFENGEDFLTEDGKFDREKFKDANKDYEFI